MAIKELITAASPKEAAETIEATFKKYGLVPQSCIPLAQSLRPNGMTIRVEFVEPVVVRFYLLHSGKILMDVETVLDDVEKLISSLSLDATPLHWVAERAGQRAKVVEELQENFTKGVRPLLQFYLKLEKVCADLTSRLVQSEE
jgi:hypothetical protein